MTKLLTIALATAGLLALPAAGQPSTDRGTRGVNELRLNRRLGEGRYRLVLVARDKAGNVSAAKRIGFRIAG